MPHPSFGCSVDLIERGLAIIGEALSQLAKLDAARAARISEHRSIIALRNILIHAYAEVDDRIVWDIVEPSCRCCVQKPRPCCEKLKRGLRTSN